MAWIKREKSSQNNHPHEERNYSGGRRNLSGAGIRGRRDVPSSLTGPSVWKFTTPLSEPHLSERNPGDRFTMASMQPRQYIKLAQSLPPRLTRFLARYPPPAILPPTSTATSETPSSTSTSTEQGTTAVTAITDGLPYANPFRAQKHPITGKWHDPEFSLRRQADLIKLARDHGIEELLPSSVKNTAERIRKRAENGLRVKGTGVGQRVKGKESERTLKGRYVWMFCFVMLVGL
jgi:large subunit ribosomal protein L25